MITCQRFHVLVCMQESLAFSSLAAQHWHIWGTQQPLAPSCDEMDGALFIPLHPGQDLFVCNTAELPDTKWDLIGRVLLRLRQRYCNSCISHSFPHAALGSCTCSLAFVSNGSAEIKIKRQNRSAYLLS